MIRLARSIDQVLSPRRLREEDGDCRASIGAELPFGLQRSPFQTDGDKISFSEGFRALADKTQVHDRAETLGTHRSRLTHSIEVASVGRSLGVSVGARMLHYYGLHATPSGETYWQVDPVNLGYSVAAACLAHDLGNPPFGHDGEDAISTFFRSGPLAGRIHALVSAPVAAQLALHEGNAQGFRMITRTMGWRAEGGLNLTAATLAAFGKYPFPLREGAKKYGVHHADLTTLDQVAEITGMIADPAGGWRRHPLAWLMEAADDISYLTVDIEDAALLGLVAPEELFGLFAPIVGPETIDRAHQIESLHRAIQFLRSRMIRTLIAGCVEIYTQVAEAIDDGTLGRGAHGSGLVSHTRHAEALEAIRRFSCARIYRSEATQRMRTVFRQAMIDALEVLVYELIGALEADGRIDARRHPELARLPGSRLNSVIPRSPDEALPWLLDEVTLLSDRQTLDIARRAGAGA